MKAKKEYYFNYDFYNMNYETNYKRYLTAATLDNTANKIMSSTFEFIWWTKKS